MQALAQITQNGKYHLVNKTGTLFTQPLCGEVARSYVRTMNFSGAGLARSVMCQRCWKIYTEGNPFQS